MLYYTTKKHGIWQLPSVQKKKKKALHDKGNEMGMEIGVLIWKCYNEAKTVTWPYCFYAFHLIDLPHFSWSCHCLILVTRTISFSGPIMNDTNILDWLFLVLFFYWLFLVLSYTIIQLHDPRLILNFKWCLVESEAQSVSSQLFFNCIFHLRELAHITWFKMVFHCMCSDGNKSNQEVWKINVKENIANISVFLYMWFTVCFL